LEAQKSINDHIATSEKVIAEQIKKPRLRASYFGSKKKAVANRH